MEGISEYLGKIKFRLGCRINLTVFDLFLLSEKKNIVTPLGIEVPVIVCVEEVILTALEKDILLGRILFLRFFFGGLVLVLLALGLTDLLEDVELSVVPDGDPVDTDLLDEVSREMVPALFELGSFLGSREKVGNAELLVKDVMLISVHHHHIVLRGGFRVMLGDAREIVEEGADLGEF